MNTAHASYYITALVAVVVAACANTAFDRWLFSHREHWPLRAYLVVAARWALVCGVMAFAYGIDSRSIPYWEPGLWGLLGVGILLVGLLIWAANRKDKQSG